MSENTNRSGKELLRRYVSFVIILFVIAFGTSLSIRANLGSSPISCPPYVLSMKPNTSMTMGQYVICMHILFILAQILLLRKRYQKIQLLQILVSFLFGLYTDVSMWITSFLQIVSDTSLAYLLRLGELLLGGGILAYGIAGEVHCDVLMLAGEGFPLAIAKVVKKDFGRVKICSDTGLACIGIILMIGIFGKWHWDMVGVGTLISMFYVGFMVRIFSRHFNWLENIFLHANKNIETEATIQNIHNISLPQASSPLIITISREYGSGGHDIGEQISKQLGINLYDHDLIDNTAKELGYSPQFVAENEQNISTSKLWELIFTDKSLPESMNPSHDDAIFVSQSRTIRNLAIKGPCIIIGRCANWILRDHKNCINIFVTSNKDFAIKRVMQKDKISAEDAAKKISQINKSRANHYWKYTGRYWTDPQNYDLVINTSKLGIAGATQIITQYIKQITS